MRYQGRLVGLLSLVSMLGVFASQASEPAGLDLVTVLILGFTAAAALFSAVASARTATATRDVAETSRMAALLTSAPLLVPWTPGKTGQIQVINRGGSTSHVLRWWIEIGGERIASGKDQRTIGPVSATNKARDLELSETEKLKIVHWSSADRPDVMQVTCRYVAAWGQEFITTRTYPPGSTESVIRVTDAHGNELKLESEPRRRLRLPFWR